MHSDLGVETVQGTLHLDELIGDMTLEAAQTLYETADLRGDEAVKSDWKTAMAILRSDSELPPTTLQRVWWLFPLYRERPAELEKLLTGIIEKKDEIEAEKSSPEDSPESTDSEDMRSGSETEEAEPESGTVDAVTDNSNAAVSVSDPDERISGKQKGPAATESTSTNETAEPDPRAETSGDPPEAKPATSETQSNTENPSKQGLVGRIRALFGR